jgi:hypothetical protein
MSWTRTLGELSQHIIDRVDVAGFSSRHPLETVRRLTIESYQRLREWMTSAGSTYWISGPYLLYQTDAIPVEYGCSIPIVSFHQSGSTIRHMTFEHIRRVEGFYTGRWHEVQRVTLIDADKWSNYLYQRYPLEFVLTGRGINTAFDDTTVPGETTQTPDALNTAPNIDTAGMERMLVMPYLGDGSCPMRIYGMPSLDMANSDQTNITLDGPGFDWIIYSVCLMITIKDNDSQGLYAMLQNEKSAAEKVIRDSIWKETSTPVRRRDVFDTADRYRYRRGF